MSSDVRSALQVVSDQIALAKLYKEHGPRDHNGVAEQVISVDTPETKRAVAEFYARHFHLVWDARELVVRASLVGSSPIHMEYLTGDNHTRCWYDENFAFRTGDLRGMRASEEDCREECEAYVKSMGWIFTGTYPGSVHWRPGNKP